MRGDGNGQSERPLVSQDVLERMVGRDRCERPGSQGSASRRLGKRSRRRLDYLDLVGVPPRASSPRSTENMPAGRRRRTFHPGGTPQRAPQAVSPIAQPGSDTLPASAHPSRSSNAHQDRKRPLTLRGTPAGMMTMSAPLRACLRPSSSLTYPVVTAGVSTCETSAATPLTTGTTSKRRSSLMAGFCLTRSERGWPIPAGRRSERGLARRPRAPLRPILYALESSPHRMLSRRTPRAGWVRWRRPERPQRDAERLGELHAPPAAPRTAATTIFVSGESEGRRREEELEVGSDEAMGGRGTGGIVVSVRVGVA